MEKTEKTAWETAEDFILRLLLDRAQREPSNPITEDLYDRKAGLFEKIREINREIQRLSRVDMNPGLGGGEPPEN